jgi:hypothetical protein
VRNYVTDNPSHLRNYVTADTLAELASMIDIQIRTIGMLYGMSDYHAPLVGGKPQICKIRPPRGAVRLAAS